MMAVWIAIFIAVMALVLAVTSLSVGYHLHRKNSHLREEVSGFHQHLTQLENNLGALCTASSGEGEHIVRLEQQMRGLAERQDDLELRVSSEQPYERATHLAQEGASVDDIINGCGLSRAEAELVIMLHGACGRG